MRVQYPLNEAKRTRILKKSELAVQRRMKAQGRANVERTARWCAIWMMALGVRQFSGN
jgi:hypothetical protein